MGALRMNAPVWVRSASLLALGSCTRHVGEACRGRPVPNRAGPCPLCLSCRSEQGCTHHPPVLTVARPNFSWLRLRVMSFDENCLRLRVRKPFVYHPHGEHDGRPPEAFPSPPPIG